ncbi:MAG TPA: glycosyltransferase family 1 protein [Nocardioidaceae bacterium]|nr:glycosyltransferase family 1 protein [Nocardioidaceae bacterium]
MRLAVDATPLLDVPTGVGLFTREVLERLGADHDLDVVAYGLTRRYRAELARRLPAGVRATAWPVPARSMLTLWRRVPFPPLEAWTGQIDVVHGPNFLVPPTRGATALMTIHDLTFVRFPELCDANTRRYPQHIVAALRRGAHVHTVSATIADEVADHFAVPRDRIHVVHNGVSVPQAADPERGRQVAGNAPFVLALGTVEPRKDLVSLVRAFDALAATPTGRDLRLVLAGKRGWGAAALDEAIRTSTHHDRIVQLGWVDDRTRADLLHAARVLAYPSIYEGFGLPPLEAMLAGVPVVTTDAGALPEIVGNASLMVPVGDVDALTEALRRVVEDATLRDLLVRNGLGRARRYSWDACARGLTDVYQRIATT